MELEFKHQLEIELLKDLPKNLRVTSEFMEQLNMAKHKIHELIS